MEREQTPGARVSISGLYRWRDFYQAGGLPALEDGRCRSAKKGKIPGFIKLKPADADKYAEQLEFLSILGLAYCHQKQFGRGKTWFAVKWFFAGHDLKSADKIAGTLGNWVVTPILRRVASALNAEANRLDEAKITG